MSLLSSFTEAALRGYSRIAPSERGAYRMVRLLRRCIGPQRWRGTFTTPGGLAYDLDLATYPDCLMAFGLYELTTARLIRRLLRPGDHFVDGGANIGYFTLLAAQCVGPGGRVDAFEPQPDNRARLEANLARSGLAQRVTVHAEALSIASGKARIHMVIDERHNHGCASLFPAADVDAAAVTTTAAVETVRLDTLLAKPPRLIKLDVEGAEPLAVAGMSALLAQPKPPALIVEYNADSAAEAGFAAREWIDRLLATQPRYRLHVIGRRVRPIHPTRRALGRLGQVNLLARCDDT